MKRIVIATAVIVLASVLAVAGIAAWRGTRPITVVIANETREPIRSAEVIHEGGRVGVHNILPGQSRSVQFTARGETSYQVALVFVSGRGLSGGGSYAEPGYSFCEHVRAKGIESELTGLSAF